MQKIALFIVLFVIPAAGISQSKLAGNAEFHSTSLGGPLFSSQKQRAIDRVRGDAPRFGKGQLPLSLTWDATIARSGNCVDGAMINCFVADSNDLYIAGDFRQFDTVPTEFLIHYNKKKNTWESLDEGPHNTVYAMVLHKGKLFVGGSFSTVGSSSMTVNHIAVWDGVWHTMSSGMNDNVNALAFIGDTLYAGGDFTQAGGNAAYHLAYWSGFDWQEAGVGTSYPVQTLYATHDSLFVGGSFTYVGNEGNTGLEANGIALLKNNDWTTFGNGFDGDVLSITMFHGKLWAAGDFFYSRDLSLHYYGLATWSDSSWTAFGHDTTVGTLGSGLVQQLLPVGDTMYVFGRFSVIGDTPLHHLAMYVNNSWKDVAGGLYGESQTGIMFDGKLWVGGRFTKAGSADCNSIATLQNGTWSIGGTGTGPFIGWQSARVAAIATTNQYVFIAGNFTSVAGKPANHIAAWNKQTKAWTTLGTGLDGSVFALVVDGNTLYAGGEFNYAGTLPARHLAKYDISSGTWSAMGNGALRNIAGIAIDKNHNVYASVYFQPVYPDWNNYLGKWDGTSWSTFGGPFIGYAEALAFQDTSLFLAGDIPTADGGTVDGIAQYADGSWNALSGGVNGPIYALCPSGTNLYVGGVFTRVDGQLGYGVAMWDGGRWDIMQTGVDNNAVYALTRSNKGVYIGGYFAGAGDLSSSISVSNLTEWNGTAYRDVAGGTDNSINALATDQNALYLGGWIEHVGPNNTPSFHFAALKGGGAGVADDTTINPAVEVYPNPAQHARTVSVSIPATHPDRVEVDVYDPLGRKLSLKTDIAPDHVTIPVATLSAGIYVLRVSIGNSILTRSFVIE